MRPIGFSTGALAKGDFRRGIDLQANDPAIDALELSALRDHELSVLVEALPSLPLQSFSYVSFHAPSRLGALSEDAVIAALLEVPSAWPIIVHPEIITTPSKWQRFGSQICIENMDDRKTTGRTVAELRQMFEVLPKAAFCLDVGHARQIDPTMTVALMMLAEFGDRLVQLHVSEVGPSGEHLPVRALAAMAFRRLAHRIPADCAVIIESMVRIDEMDDELTTVCGLFEQASQVAIA